MTQLLVVLPLVGEHELLQRRVALLPCREAVTEKGHEIVEVGTGDQPRSAPSGLTLDPDNSRTQLLGNPRGYDFFVVHRTSSILPRH
ncbi:hypothetical protein [Mycolicibacterium porcinum]|uniref:Uncharacterized protein n=1 Tax=Mycolicibacterium porcinum TaxID=39693 RepID=A0AAW5SZ94_9MYCO|nr:hypothetical protein [Mycolicibacterium porcinum]MCV7388141.1 hypothetical protein [Mycolicibacterium porcinum]